MHQRLLQHFQMHCFTTQSVALSYLLLNFGEDTQKPAAVTWQAKRTFRFPASRLNTAQSRIISDTSTTLCCLVSAVTMHS